MTRKDLVSKTCHDFIVDNYNEEETENIFVAEIDTNYIDGIALCEHYNVAKESGVNCLIVECKRGQTKSYAALLVTELNEMRDNNILVNRDECYDELSNYLFRI